MTAHQPAAGQQPATDPSGNIAAEAAGHGPASLDARHRQVLSGLADVLIPAGADMPSASEAGVAGHWLDEVLRARPDLAEELAALLEAAADEDPATAIQRLQDEAGSGIAVLSTVVPGAYFMNPDIQARIGYHGQEARPIPEPSLTDEDQLLLREVVERGTIYRS